MRKTIMVLAAVLTTSCATTDYFLADGHRAAGTVTLVCNYDMFTECPDRPSTEQAFAASQACIRWGYTGARAFGSISDITADGISGRLEMIFQCTGHLEEE